MKFIFWRIVAIVLIAFLVLSIWYLYEMNEASRRNCAVLTREKSALEKKVNGLNDARKTLEEDVTRINGEKSKLAIKIEEYGATMQKMSSDYEAGTKKMQDQLDKLNDQLAARAEDLANKNAELSALMKEKEEYEKRKQESEGKANISDKTGKSVTLETITVTTPKGKKKDAQVMDVNTKYSFVMLNAGSSSGIKEGDALYIIRKKKLLGMVVVEKVDENCCAAKILYKTLADAVRKGDLVSY